MLNVQTSARTFELNDDQQKTNDCLISHVQVFTKPSFAIDEVLTRQILCPDGLGGWMSGRLNVWEAGCLGG